MTDDNRGFADKPYWEDRRADGALLKLYETLGLAWGVYAAAIVGDRLEMPQRMVERLLAQQDPATGGFHTHFGDITDHLVDPNVETTSVALLALALVPEKRAALKWPQYTHHIPQDCENTGEEHRPSCGYAIPSTAAISRSISSWLLKCAVAMRMAL